MSFVFVPLVSPNKTIPCPSPDLSCLFPRLSFFVSLYLFLVSHPFVPRHPSLIVSHPSSQFHRLTSLIPRLSFTV